MSSEMVKLKHFKENQNLDMVRFTVIINNNFIKLGKDSSGRLYRIVKSDIRIHKGDDEYFCFIQLRKGLFWSKIEVIDYEDYLQRVNN